MASSWRSVNPSVLFAGVAAPFAKGAAETPTKGTQLDEGDLEVMFFLNNVMDKIGVRNMSTDDETQGFLRSVVPTLPRMGGISFTKKFGAY